MKGTKLAIAVTLAAIVLILALFLFEGPEPEISFRVTGIAAEFMKILPDDLSGEKLEEISGLLARFQYRVRQGEMPGQDEVEVKRELAGYVERGSITEKELYRVMARVGYYTFRGETPDSIGMHPLLEDPQPR